MWTSNACPWPKQTTQDHPQRHDAILKADAKTARQTPDKALADGAEPFERVQQCMMPAMAEARTTHGLKSVLRITPNDTREMARPARRRSGQLDEATIQTFAGLRSGRRGVVEPRTCGRQGSA